MTVLSEDTVIHEDAFAEPILVAFSYKRDGEEQSFFLEGQALAVLLAHEIVVANSRFHRETDKEEIRLVVICSDVFAWACCDAEPLPYSEIKPLYEVWKKEGSNGVDKWCCKRRQQRPQPPVERQMRAAGVWDDEMEALPLNTQDAQVAAVFASMCAPAELAVAS